MKTYWERTTVSGTDEEGKRHSETVLHRRGEDALRMAVRRNSGLAGCQKIWMETEEAFLSTIKEETHKEKREIPRDNIGKEWDYDDI